MRTKVKTFTGEGAVGQSLIKGACLGCERRTRRSCGLALEHLSEGKTRGSEKGKEVVTESYKAL